MVKTLFHTRCNETYYVVVGIVARHAKLHILDAILNHHNIVTIYGAGRRCNLCLKGYLAINDISVDSNATRGRI